MEKKAIVIGGGFFGTSVAVMLRELGLEVTLLEREGEFLTRASRVNQARVHGGYHYPRSLVTAFRSRQNYERFRHDYREAICDKFTKLYAVGRNFSKVTADQFALFMKRIGAPLEVADDEYQKLFNPTLVEQVWVAEECAFDYSILRDLMVERMAAAGVRTELNTDVLELEKVGEKVLVRTSQGQELEADWVINATYSGLNRLKHGAEKIPLKHELAEMALVEIPDELKGVALTMMCGPFFSFMPYPAENLHTLSHVRYTPHGEWREGEGGSDPDPYAKFERMKKQTAYPYMIADAKRFMPALEGAVYRDSIWEVKTVLPKNESDDGRPILFRKDSVTPGLVHVMGGKIDNIFDVKDELVRLI